MQGKEKMKKKMEHRASGSKLMVQKLIRNGNIRNNIKYNDAIEAFDWCCTLSIRDNVRGIKTSLVNDKQQETVDRE